METTEYRRKDMVIVSVYKKLKNYPSVLSWEITITEKAVHVQCMGTKPKVKPNKKILSLIHILRP